MKDIKEFINESKNFKLESDERQALSDLVGMLCGNIGDDADIKQLKPVIDQLSKDEIKQLDSLHDCLDDGETYKKINRNNIIDDIPLLKKIYGLMEDNDLLGEQWDLIDALDKINEY